MYFSNSDLIHRRAAPMPRTGSSCDDNVWRVPKLTSLRIRASMFAAEISLTIFSICGLRREPVCDCCEFAKGTDDRDSNAMKTKRATSRITGRLLRKSPHVRTQSRAHAYAEYHFKR